MTEIRHEVEFADVITKQTVENWGDDKGLDAVGKIHAHFRERFGLGRFCILSAKDNTDHLELEVKSDQWDRAREFALDSAGNLIW